MPQRDLIEQGADLILAACLAGVQPEDVTGWVIVAQLRDDRARVRTNLCCVSHAGQALADTVIPEMIQLPPCRASGG